MDDTARTKIFEILEKRLLPDTDLQRGRPGMSLWRILVLGVLKMAIDCDFDRLGNLVARHSDVRMMLGHSEFGDDTTYHVQTLVDNVSLLTEEVLEEISEAVVACGHRELGVSPGDPLRCRVDSSVAKAHVDCPTDVGLLWDAVHCMVREAHCVCNAHDIPGWRKHKYLANRLQKSYYSVRTSRQWRDTTKVERYLALCQKLVLRAETSVDTLKAAGIPHDKVLHYLGHAQRQVDQVHRRLILGEVIPHEEKVFSIHESHVQWKNKGKAGVKAELGMMVTSMEDQHPFIVQHKVVRKGVDSDMIVPFMEKAKRRNPSLISCSMDRGFYSPSNREKLDELLELNAMPKKGGRTKEDMERELAPDFVEARRQHPAIESAINNLNQRGLSLIRTHGEEGFVRTVALVVVAANVHRLGLILRAKESRKIRWHAARKRAA